MGLLEDCEKYFQADSLYRLFDVPKNVKEANLKKAYYKLSLKVHPDKAEDGKKEEANRQFQIVTKAYYILSDKEKRAIYDEQGIVDDEDVCQEKDWAAYWRELFPKVTLKDIEDFMKKYKGSEDEQKDLIKFYEKFKGNMLKVFEFMPGSSISEESRYRDILEELISDGKVQDYPDFHVKEASAHKSKRMKKAQKEAEEAEATLAEMGYNKDSDLTKAISQRQTDRKSNFDSLINNLEAKYSKPQTARRGKKKF